MAEEIQISELELKEDLAGDLVFPVESSTDTNSTTLSALKDWLKTFFVGLAEDEIITGKKTFAHETTMKAVQDVDLGQLRLIATDESYGVVIRVDDAGGLYFLITNEGDPNGSWNDLRPLKINLTNGAVSGITPELSTNNTIFPTTAWVKNILKSSGNGLATISKAQNGYCKFTNGLLIQWGNSGTYSNTQVKTITLPTAFGNTNYVVLPMNSGTTSNNYYTYQPHSQTTSNFKLRCQDTGGSASGSVRWVAIGY